MQHIRDVAEDYITHTWEGVHEWSMNIMEYVGTNEMSWHDETEIRHERQTTARKRIKLDPYIEKIPCPEWNEGDCEEEKLHDSKVPDMKWVHICAVCWYTKAEKQSNHHAKICFSNKDAKPKFAKKPFKGKPKDQVFE